MKLINEIKIKIKNNYKFILILLFLILSFSIKFPYYIDAPGGITDISKKISLDNNKSKGSFNLAYVKEYRATIPTLLISLFNKDYNVISEKELLLDNENNSIYEKRDKILMDEAISNAIFVAYSKANRPIKIISNELVVAYISKEAHTNLQVNDKIKYINNTKIYSKEDISNIINKFDVGNKININVNNNDDRFAYVMEENESKKIGIILSSINKYETNPKINIIKDERESGPSGGLITSLAIYNILTGDDLTHGLTIVGTGTIDFYGNVGIIGGVEYKIKSAVKNNADLFIVPKDNLEEANKVKKENNYKIEIIGVSTFDETVEILRDLKID